MDAEELINQVADSVRSALEEAQRRAQEIVDEAEARAERIRAEAEEAAKRARAEAETQAQRRLAEVRTALDELQGRLAGGGEPARGKAGDRAESEVDPGPVTVPEPEPPLTPEPLPDPGEPAPEPVPEPAPVPVPEPYPPPDEPVAGAGEDAAAGDAKAAENGADSAARLVAMKLALDGVPRDQARERLAADYEVADLDGLLDEVYAKAGR